MTTPISSFVFQQRKRFLIRPLKFEQFLESSFVLVTFLLDREFHHAENVPTFNLELLELTKKRIQPLSDLAQSVGNASGAFSFWTHLYSTIMNSMAERRPIRVKEK